MKLLFLLFTLTVSAAAFGQAGHIDTTFNGFPGSTGYEDRSGAQGWVTDIVAQSDGRLLVSGYMSDFDGVETSHLIRIGTDGNVDPTFEFTGMAGIGVVVQRPDGKFYIGGAFDYPGSGLNSGIGLINASGSPNSVFNHPNTGVSQQGSVTDIAVQSNGDILIVGLFQSYHWNGNMLSQYNIARIHEDGSGDITFAPVTSISTICKTIALLPDGKMIVGGYIESGLGAGVNQCYLVRLNSDGTLDADLWGNGAPEGVINQVEVLPNGQIYVAGTFDEKILRVNTDGSVDASFDAIFPSFIPPVNTGLTVGVNKLLLQPDGKVVIGGYFATAGGVAGIGRLNTDGSWDNTFTAAVGSGVQGQREMLALALTPGGTIVAGGDFDLFNHTGRNNIVELNANGEVTPKFKVTGASRMVRTVKVRQDNKVLIGGDFRSYHGSYRNGLALLNADGTLDTGFDPETGFDYIRTAVFQQDNKVLVSGGLDIAMNGNLSDQGLIRLNPNGSLDASFVTGTGPSFNNNNDYSYVGSFVPLNNGTIIIGGFFNEFNEIPASNIARLLANGSIDPSFNCVLNGSVTDIARQPDGKLVVLGGFTISNGVAHSNIVRLNPDGSNDESFNAVQVAEYGQLALQPDGKILIIGYQSHAGVYTGITRLNANGSQDNTFIPGAGSENPVAGGLLQPDGKIVIYGQISGFNGTPVNRIARLNADGTLDPFFFLENGMDLATTAYFRIISAAMQSDGNIVIGGSFLNYEGVRRNHLARIRNDVAGLNNLQVSFDNVDNVTCTAGGTVTADCTGGMAPYSFLWNTGQSTATITMAAGGVYQVTVTDALGVTGTAALLIDAPVTPQLDVNVNLLTTPFRPGFGSTVWLNAFNDGCIPATGQLTLTFDPLLNFVSSNPTPSVVNGNTLTWDFTNLAHTLAPITPQIEFNVDVAAAIGDSIELTVDVTPVSGDVNPLNNNKSYTAPVVNGYDPNIKSVYPVGKCDVGYVEPDQILTYTVQFQNTGNSEAINIVVSDMIDDDLDLNSLRIVGKSHEMSTKILPGNMVEFHFDNIHLADSTSNEPASHGYVIFEVKPVTSWLNHNTEIVNKADIFFDFNPAITTNEVSNLIYQGDDLETFNCFEAGIGETTSETMVIYPNPTTGNITVQFPQEIQAAVIVVVDLQGKEVARKEVTYASAVTLDISTLEAGVYLLSVRDRNGKIIERNRKISKTDG